ncbi:alkaline phosphatase [Paraferrimonas sedimenticola]|uniref:Alkaline phosphatase n=1 Tax=Paraferrimonas sedimenticola TaxID=375674 RepID=A0AA37RTY2_9GAMM|nr:alkaline phosphatase [Paraferrimonas sedimenticola]GLP95580.1 alkaline phosphatase [Paraferrimonas sedimenticola]
MRIHAIALSALLLLAPNAFAEGDAQPTPIAAAQANNIIIMIGDGMGPAVTTGYRYFQDNPDSEEIEETVFDRLLVGMASTYPAHQSGYVTDSAAAATALAAGVKTYNGAIGLDSDKQPVTSVMRMAQQRGMSIGLAVTSQINHATPAAYMAHNEHRRNYAEIMETYVESPADVMLGGGRNYFTPGMLATLKNKGFAHITEYSKLDDVASPPVLGLFGDVSLPRSIDDTNPERLSLLTEHALRLLGQNPNGFLLLVEGSQIDWAGHARDIHGVMSETKDFAYAIEVVEQFVRLYPNSTMVVTADHGTGGLTLAKSREYLWQPQVLHNLTASLDTIAKISMNNPGWEAEIGDKLGFGLTQDEWQALSKAQQMDRDTGEPKQFTKALKALLDTRTNTGWTTSGHTAVDVPVMAKGRGAELFIGYQDNTEIATKLMSLLPKQENTAGQQAHTEYSASKRIAVN